MMSVKPKIDQITLLAGVDIPIPELRLVITQPILRDIAVIGEGEFFASAYMISKSLKDTMDLSDMEKEEQDYWNSRSNLEILTLAFSGDAILQLKTRLFFSLLTPSQVVTFVEDGISFVDPDGKEVIVDSEGFDILSEYLKIILKLDMSDKDVVEDFNPIGSRAEEIAAKLKANRLKVKNLKASDGPKAGLASFISAFSIGTGISINTVFDYTIYQFQDLLERFNLFTEFELSTQAKMAGAKDVESVNIFKRL